MSARPEGGRLHAGARAVPASREEWVERVRSATDIVELIGQTVQLRKVGRNWVGLCPFHQEKTPSFSVHAERQFYHCFSCKAGGDVFKFIQETEKLSFLEAVEMLSRRAGIAVPERRGEPGEPGRRARLLETLDAAAAAYESWLGDPERGAEARAYLERRGVSRETVRAFRLGFVPAGWENLVKRLAPRFPEEALIEAGLAVRRANEGSGPPDTRPAVGGSPGAGRGPGVYDRFRNRLMVPLVAPGGAVVGFGARALAEEDVPKYLNSPETPVYHKGAFLFALDAARRHAAAEGELIVVEGYFDAIALHQAGLSHAVATSGTALTEDQARLLRRVAPRVTLTFDGDAAGQGAMLRSLGVLFAAGLDVAVVELPTGVDPDSLLRERGPDGWRAAREAAYDAVEFIQRHMLRAQAGAPGGLPGPGVDARERALQAVVELGLQGGDEIRRRLFLERASRVFGFSAEVLARATELRHRGQRSAEPIRAAVRAQRQVALSLERQALQALLRSPAELDYARSEISPADFEDPACAALAAELWRDPAGPFAPEPLAALARELLAADDEGPGRAEDPALRATFARMATLKLALRRLARELRGLAARQAQAGESEDRERAREFEEVLARQLVREELYRRLFRQAQAEPDESNPDQILMDIKQIEMRATGQSND